MLQCVTDYGFQFVYVSFIEFEWQLETHTKGRWLGWNTRCKAISLFCVLQYPSCVCADGKNVVNCVKQTEIHHRSAMKILLNTHIKRGIEAIQKSFFNEISNDSAANIEASWEEHWEMSFEWENHRMCKHLPNESISKHDVDFEIAPNSFSLSLSVLLFLQNVIFVCWLWKNNMGICYSILQNDFRRTSTVGVFMERPEKQIGHVFTRNCSSHWLLVFHPLNYTLILPRFAYKINKIAVSFTKFWSGMISTLPQLGSQLS